MSRRDVECYGKPWKDDGNLCGSYILSVLHNTTFSKSNIRYILFLRNSQFYDAHQLL